MWRCGRLSVGPRYVINCNCQPAKRWFEVQGTLTFPTWFLPSRFDSSLFSARRVSPFVRQGRSWWPWALEDRPCPPQSLGSYPSPIAYFDRFRWEIWIHKTQFWRGLTFNKSAHIARRNENVATLAWINIISRVYALMSIGVLVHDPLKLFATVNLFNSSDLISAIHT